MTKPGDGIEARIAADDWEGARALIERELHRRPDDHWLLARLALSYYEQHLYEKPLVDDAGARQLARDCPLLLRVLAGTLDMLVRD